MCAFSFPGMSAIKPSALVTSFHACATRFITDACALEPRRRFVTERKGKEKLKTKPSYLLKLPTVFPLEILSIKKKLVAVLQKRPARLAFAIS